VSQARADLKYVLQLCSELNLIKKWFSYKELASFLVIDLNIVKERKNSAKFIMYRIKLMYLELKRKRCPQSMKIFLVSNNSLI